jgi:hypothetical protein
LKQKFLSHTPSTKVKPSSHPPLVETFVKPEIWRKACESFVHVPTPQASAFAIVIVDKQNNAMNNGAMLLTICLRLKRLELD